MVYKFADEGDLLGKDGANLAGEGSVSGKVNIGFPTEENQKTDILAQIIKGTEGTLRAMGRSMHKDAGELDATQQKNQLRGQEELAFQRYFATNDPENADYTVDIESYLRQVNAGIPYTGVPIKYNKFTANPVDLVKRYQKYSLWKTKFQSTELGQEFAKQKAELTRLQYQSPEERVAMYGVGKTFVGEENAKKTSGVTTEDLKANPETLIGASVLGEGVAMVAGAKIASVVPKLAVAKSLPFLGKIAPKLVKPAIATAKFTGSLEAVKQVARPGTLKEKTVKVAKSAGGGAAIGAGFGVVGAGVSDIVKGVSKTVGKVASKVSSKVVKTLEKNPVYQNLVKVSKEKATKFAGMMEKGQQDVKKLPSYQKLSKAEQDLVTNFVLSPQKHVDSIKNVFRQRHDVLLQSGSDEFAAYKLFLRRDGEKAVEVFERFTKINGKALKKMTEVERKKIGEYLIGLKKDVKLTPKEMKVAKGMRGLLDHFKSTAAKEMNVPVESLKKNYVPTYYDKQTLKIIEEAGQVGANDKATLDILKTVLDKDIPLNVLKKLQKRIPGTFKSGRLLSKKLTDAEADLFREKDVVKIGSRFVHDMANIIEKKRMAESLNRVLKVAKNVEKSKQVGVHIPLNRQIYLQNMVKTYVKDVPNLAPLANKAAQASLKEAGFTKLSQIDTPLDAILDKGLTAAVWANLSFKAAFAVRNVTQQSLLLFTGVPMRDLATTKKVLLGSWVPGKGFNKIPYKYKKYLAQSSLRSRVLGKGVVADDLASVAIKEPGSIASQRIKKIAFGSITVSDRANIQTSIISARLWAKRVGMPDKLAARFADDVTALTQFLYKGTSRAPITGSAAGRAAFVFRGWPVNYTDLMLTGRKSLFKNYGTYLGKDTLGKATADTVKYLTTQYAAIAALQTATGLDISSADPVSTGLSVLNTPLDMMRGNFPIKQLGENVYKAVTEGNLDSALKAMPANQITRFLTGKKSNPFGTNLDETKGYKKNNLIPRPSDLIQDSINQ